MLTEKPTVEVGVEAAIDDPALIATKSRHLWVRFGGPAFCGKAGCGMIMTKFSQQAECRGVEGAFASLLRYLKEPPRAK